MCGRWGGDVFGGASPIFWRFLYGVQRMVYCSLLSGCSAPLLPLCFPSARHRLPMALPSRMPRHYWHTWFSGHQSAIPKTWQLSAIYVEADLYRVEIAIYIPGIERIWRASGYTGEHLVHMHPVNVWFLGEGFPSSTDEETSGNTSRGLIPSLTILVQCRFITFESNMLMFTGFEHDFILVYILYWSAYVCLYAELDYICTIYERKQN